VKLIKSIQIIFAFLTFLLAADIANAGLGISPSRIIANHLFRDSRYEQTFVLSRSDPKEVIVFKVMVDDSIKEWITTDKGTEFTWPAGQQRFPITVIVQPPSDTANGSYKGNIELVSMPKPQQTQQDNGAGVVFTAVIQADFTVTGEQVLEYQIPALKIETVEEGMPLSIALTVANTGNVKARPTGVHIDIYDKFKNTLLESYDVTEMEFVDAFKRDDIQIKIPNKLGVGQYWAVISVYRDDILLKEQSLVFEIVEVGRFKKEGILKQIINKEEVEPGEIIKITGVFQNTGEVLLSAKLISEIYTDGRMVNLAESESISVDKGKTENFTAYFFSTKKGQYIIKSYVAYS